MPMLRFRHLRHATRLRQAATQKADFSWSPRKPSSHSLDISKDYERVLFRAAAILRALKSSFSARSAGHVERYRHHDTS